MRGIAGQAVREIKIFYVGLLPRIIFVYAISKYIGTIEDGIPMKMAYRILKGRIMHFPPEKKVRHQD